jgi:hypothetical protein
LVSPSITKKLSFDGVREETPSATWPWLLIPPQLLQLCKFNAGSDEENRGGFQDIF